MITYLAGLRVYFLCQKCGDFMHIDVPQGSSVTRSYCCNAKYKVTHIKGLRVRIRRVKKKTAKK